MLRHGSPSCSSAVAVCACLARLLVVWDGFAFGCFSAKFLHPPFERGCALIPAPCNMQHFPSLHSFLLLLHLTVAPSSLYHYHFLLSFSFFTTSAYRIGLSLFQGNPSHSFLQTYCSPFI